MFHGLSHDMQNMAVPHFLVLVAVVAGVTLYLFYRIWSNLHSARIIEDTPTAKVRSAPQGYVELEGRALNPPQQITLAPLTRTRCVWYRFRIEEERAGGRSGSSHWATVESGISESPFVFQDDTGECLVDPRGADVTPGVRKVWHGSTRWPGGVERRGLFGALTGRRYRYTEERIEQGEVYVLGWFDTLHSTDIPVSAEVARVLRSWKQDAALLRQRFDSNGDGVLDPAEWSRAREAAHREVLGERAARSAQPAVNSVRASGHDRYPFLISARPQLLLTGRYRRRALLSLLGSVVATAALAWMLSARF